MMERLGAYEDTGLTPEEVLALMCEDAAEDQPEERDVNDINLRSEQYVRIGDLLERLRGTGVFDDLTPEATGILWRALDACAISEDALQEAPEAKVLTLEELMAMPQVWGYDTPPYLWMEIHPEIRDTGFWVDWRVVLGMITGHHPTYTDENYGADWRCWFIRPAQAQAEKTPWR